MARRKRKPWLHDATERNFALGDLSIQILKMAAIYDKNKNETEKVTRYGCIFVLLFAVAFIIFVEMNTFTWIILAIILTFLIVLWLAFVMVSAYIAEARNKVSSAKVNELFDYQETVKESDTVPTRSRRIPNSVKHEVWRRDQGRCAQCGSNENLEFDHIIPFSKGGSNTARNIQLLCENCNRSKGAKI